MEIRPAIFGGTDVMADDQDDLFGVLTTQLSILSFSFKKIANKKHLKGVFL